MCICIVPPYALHTIPVTHVAAAPSQGVQNISATATSATEVRVSWRPPELQAWNGVLTNYTIGEYRGGGDSYHMTLQEWVGQLWVYSCTRKERSSELLSSTVWDELGESGSGKK